MEKKSTVRSLIDAWPTRKALAADIGVSAARVHKWAQANAIPARFHLSLLGAAQSRGIDVTSDDLVRMHAVPADTKDAA